MAEHEHTVVDTGEDEVTVCAVHPDRETSLRCNKCGRYMCVECAVQTPVGYRCRECVRSQDDKFYTGTTADYIIAFTVAAVLAGIGGFIVKALNIWLLFVLIAAFPVGGVIGEAVMRATSKRRGRQSGKVAAAAAAVGGLVGGGLQVYVALGDIPAQVLQQMGQDKFDLVFRAVFQDIGLLLFVALLAVAVYGRFQVKI